MHANLLIFCHYTDQIDDELHLLLGCPFHYNERTSLLSNLGIDPKGAIPKEMFINIMKDKNENNMRHLGRFLHDCFEKRKQSLLQ